MHSINKQADSGPARGGEEMKQDEGKGRRDDKGSNKERMIESKKPKKQIHILEHLPIG
jgi:hypothetical protein